MKWRFKKKGKQGKAPATEPVKAVVCDDIEQISFASFLKCAINYDFSPLIVSGVPSEPQLFIAWITILSKYYELIGSKESLRYVQLVCKMERLNLRIEVVSSICEALRLNYNEDMARSLNEWGFRREFTPESIAADLAFVDNQLQTDNYNLKKAQQEFEKQEKQNGRQGKVTKENYMRTLYAIERYVNRDGGRQSFHPNDITLYKFAILYNEMVEYHEAIRKAHGKL